MSKQAGGVPAAIVSTDIINTVITVMPGSFCHLAQFDQLHYLHYPSTQNKMGRSILPIGKTIWSVLIHLKCLVPFVIM